MDIKNRRNNCKVRALAFFQFCVCLKVWCFEIVCFSYINHYQQVKNKNRFVTKEIENFKNYLTSIIPMDDDVFNLSQDFFKIENIKKGDFFIEEGKTCNNVAYIDRGLFRIYYIKDGMEVNTCFCKENSITSSFESLVNRTPSNQFIQAIEDATLVKLSYENLNKL